MIGICQGTNGVVLAPLPTVGVVSVDASGQDVALRVLSGAYFYWCSSVFRSPSFGFFIQINGQA